MARIDSDFYAGDREEPPHVHVERDELKAKCGLDPARLQRSHGFTAAKLHRLERVVVENQQLVLDRWNEFFSD